MDVDRARWAVKMWLEVEELSLGQLADKLDISRAHLHTILSGYRPVTYRGRRRHARLIEKLKTVTGVDLDNPPATVPQEMYR